MLLILGFSGKPDSDSYPLLSALESPISSALSLHPSFLNQHLSPLHTSEFPRRITTMGFVHSFSCHCTRRQDPGPY